MASDRALTGDDHPELVPYELHGTRVLHDDVVRIEEHDVTTVDGRAFTMAVTVSRGFVVVLPVLPSREVVLVRQYRHTLGRVTLEVPAGAIDPDEEPRVAVERELAEETLLRAGSIEHLGTFADNPGRSTGYAHLYLALDCTADPSARAHEPTAPVTMTLERALEEMGREVDSTSSCLALLLAHRRLGSAA
jgi:ADP-ribose pyrophosphatase